MQTYLRDCMNTTADAYFTVAFKRMLDGYTIQLISTSELLAFDVKWNIRHTCFDLFEKIKIDYLIKFVIFFEKSIDFLQNAIFSFY